LTVVWTPNNRRQPARFNEPGDSAMVDNIQANKILPPLSSASEVKRLDRRGRHNQQTPFKEASKPKQKKKKDPDEPDPGATSDHDLETGAKKRDGTSGRSDRMKRKKTNDSSRKRIIDIRV
jgi:hypothetical protein